MKKVTILAAKVELKPEQDKIKLQSFVSSYVRGKGHFEDDGTQNYLFFQPMHRYFKKIGISDHISAWKFKRIF